MVLNLEHNLPAVGIPADGGKRLSKLPGTTDCAALVVPHSKHCTSSVPLLIIYPVSFSLQARSLNPRLLNLSGRKLQMGYLSRRQSQTRTSATAVAGMHGTPMFLWYARFPAATTHVCLHSQKDIVRGAVTNGHEWLFIVLSRNKNGSGGGYRLPPALELWYAEG